MDDPHDDAFADAPPDSEFVTEQARIREGTMTLQQPKAFAARAEPSIDDPAARFTLDWVDGTVSPTYPADPTYPNGVAIDVALDAERACRLELPYPTPRRGLWLITCRTCGYAMALSTAGRADDPRSVRMPCRPR